MKSHCKTTKNKKKPKNNLTSIILGIFESITKEKVEKSEVKIAGELILSIIFEKQISSQ